MDNLCIDLKDKTVEYEINEKQEPILKFYSGKSTKYVINDETLDKFYDIISKRNNGGTDVTQSETVTNELKELKSKMSETQTELNIKLDRQNEEMKQMMQMIQKLLSKPNE